MRKTFLYYNRLALFLTVVFSLFSCNSFVNDIEENKSDNVIVTFAITGYESSERTIIPSTADTQTLYFKLEGKEVATGKEAVLINCKKYEDFSSITLKLNAGDWDFKITGYLDEEGTKAVITGSKNNVNIKPGENNIVFDMKPDVTQKGSIKITLKYDLGTDTQSEISEVSVKRTDTSFASLFETKWEKGNPSDYIVVSDITDGKGYITFTETNVASGSYFLAFEVKTKNGTETGLGYRRDLVIVTGSCESAAELELKVTQAYKITYENEDKSPISNINWRTGYERPEYYTSYKSVSLPTSDDLSRDSYNFVGWYTKDGASIDKTKNGATGPVTFYARWQSNSLFVSKNGNDDSNDGSQAHPFATVNKALTIPNNSQLPWTIYIMDDIKENVQIAIQSSKAQCITIQGSDGSSSITADTTSAITVTSTVPVIISNITIKGGNGTSVESTTGGGCLFVNTADVNVTVGTNAILRDGKAKSGAAVYVNNGKVILDKTGLGATDGGSIESNGENISGVKGGGVYVASSGTLEIKSGTIKNNYADAGGGIYNAGGTVTMTGGSISGNSAGITENGNGGGVYNSGTTGTTKKFIFSGGTITDNRAGKVPGAGDTFTKTSQGGGIYNEAGAEVTISGSATVGKEVSGAITPSNCANYSNLDGGGIYNEGTLSITGIGYIITGNYAFRDGGGVCSTVNFDNYSKITGNEGFDGKQLKMPSKTIN